MTTHGSPVRVVVFGLGGTIAMSADDEGGAVPSLTAGQLLAAVPGLAAAGATVAAVDFRHRPGSALTFDDISALSAAIADAFAGGAAGAVVTQGTDSIEETAYLLDLLHSGPQPIVVTGAMRNPSLAGPDGPANLLAAVQTAASVTARGLGALVVFAGEIHAAVRVRKTHSTSVATFQSPDTGPLGHVVEGVPVVPHRPVGRFVVPVLGPGVAGPGAPPVTAPAVGLVTITMDDRGEVWREAAATLDGLVVAAMGVGHVPESLVPLLETLAARRPVVLASRTGSGPVLTGMYGFAGSERDLTGRGLIPAGFLHPLKARILLHTLLRAGADRPTIGTAFAVAGGRLAPDAWPWAA